MSSIDAVAFELWTISDGIQFDNVLITDSVDVANYVLDHTYQLKKEISDAETDNWFVKMVKETNKKPWLWIVYVLIIAVPLLLFIGYCCVTPGRRSPDKAESYPPAADYTEETANEEEHEEHSTPTARPRKTKRAE